MTAAPTMPDLCRAAADAVTRLCATLRDCAREVEERKGCRVARGSLIEHTGAAVVALRRVLSARQWSLIDFREIDDMIGGCSAHYPREAWALRLLQMAAMAPESRDTEPPRGVCPSRHHAYACALPIGHIGLHGDGTTPADTFTSWPDAADTRPTIETCGCQCFNCRAALHHLCERPHGCGPTPPCACGAATGESHRAGCVCLGEMATTCGGGTDG